MNLLIDPLPCVVELCGKNVPIETDFRTGILFEEAIQDESLGDIEKIQTALELYFPSAEFSYYEAVEAVEKLLWFYRCGRETLNNEETDGDFADPSFSYEHDAAYIYSAFMQAYKIDLVKENLHWWQFRALFEALPEDTQFVKIIGYRNIKLTSKMSREERQYYEKMKRLYALPKSEERQQLESDLSALLMNGGNPASILGGKRSCLQTEH